MAHEQAESGAFERFTELQLLEALESNPETTQADLATKAGVAVGTVNWYIKRWSAKGLVKVKRIGRWRWRYLLTPQGMAEKADLANRYFQASMRVYRQARAQAKELIGEIRDAGYDQVAVNGDGDLAEIVRLTALEMNMRCMDFEPGCSLPVISSSGLNMQLDWPENHE